MCTLCSQIAPIASDCVLGRETPTPLLAVITEGSDAPANASTGYEISTGDSFQGTVSGSGDFDWIAIDLSAGQTIEISLSGASGGGGTLGDPTLYVTNPGGTAFLAFDDDSGTGFDSALSFTASSAGTYYIEAGSDWGSTGSYTLSVDTDNAGPTTPTPNPGDGSIEEMAEYLTDGYWASTGFSGFAFGDGNITVNLTGLTSAGQQLARWALEAWEMVADLNFVEVSGSAEMTFQDHESGAFAGPDAVDGNGVNSESTVNVDSGWLTDYGTGIDSYSFSTYIHEIGHALGLGHQGPYNGGANFGSSAIFDLDSTQMSIMSYFSQTQNPNTDATYGEIISAMMVDIVAIQNLYGAPGSGGVTAGNTVFGANTNLDNYMGTFFDVLAGGTAPAGFLTEGADMALTIYDQGGTDTINLNFSTANNYLSLEDGTFSNLEGQIGNLGIAVGTQIEIAIGGAGRDTIEGNDAANGLYGGAGNDSILGGGGNDNLGGGAGNDTIDGGGGADEAYGAAGNDVLYGGAGDDLLGGTTGNDTLYGGDGADALWGAWGNDVVFGGAGNDTLGGFLGDDNLSGGAGADELWGSDGTDTLSGDNGNDALGGGNDADTLYGGAGNDQVSGGGGGDVISGGTGFDTLFGAAGNDTLEGGAGNDVIYGGSGADTFVFGAGDGDDDINGFNLGQGDTLQLDDALWSGGLTGWQVVNQFATDAGSSVVFDFGAVSFELMGVDSTAGLAAAIDIV